MLDRGGGVVDLVFCVANEDSAEGTVVVVRAELCANCEKDCTEPESDPADILDRGEVVLAVIEGLACNNNEVSVAAAFISTSVSCVRSILLLPRPLCFPLVPRLSLRLLSTGSSRLVFACDLVPSARLNALGRPVVVVAAVEDDTGAGRCSEALEPLRGRGAAAGGRVGAAIGGSLGLCIVRACLAGGGASIDEYRLGVAVVFLAAGAGAG